MSLKTMIFFTKHNVHKTETCNTIDIIEISPKQMVDCNKRNVMGIKERLFLEKLGENHMFMHPTLECRNAFFLHGALINFKQRLNSAQGKLIKAMKVNPTSAYTKS